MLAVVLFLKSTINIGTTVIYVLALRQLSLSTQWNNFINRKIIVSVYKQKQKTKFPGKLLRWFLGSIVVHGRPFLWEYPNVAPRRYTWLFWRFFSKYRWLRQRHDVTDEVLGTIRNKLFPLNRHSFKQSLKIALWTIPTQTEWCVILMPLLRPLRIPLGPGNKTIVLNLVPIILKWRIPNSLYSN